MLNLGTLVQVDHILFFDDLSKTVFVELIYIHI